jgi:hypothetical protein
MTGCLRPRSAPELSQLTIRQCPATTQRGFDLALLSHSTSTGLSLLACRWRGRRGHEPPIVSPTQRAQS